jgi:hypothetical protein
MVHRLLFILAARFCTFLLSPLLGFSGGSSGNSLPVGKLSNSGCRELLMIFEMRSELAPKRWRLNNATCSWTNRRLLDKTDTASSL